MAVPKNSQRPDLLLHGVQKSAGAQSPVGAANQIAAILCTFCKDRLRATPLPARVCVALSGGCDSVVLLQGLRELVIAGRLPITLSALHVHHGISPHADAWAAFCAQLCDEWAVPLQICHVDVARNSGEGLEAAARRARHGAFSDCDADWLLLAHHCDDQAETVLLNLLRGAGIAGAAGMLSERPQARGPRLLRPLLGVSRQRIEDCANELGLQWIEDESNDDRHFRRNFLRHAIFPALEDKFPGSRQSLARAAEHFAECDQLLADLARLDRAATRAASGRVEVSAINALTRPRARNLLRFLWLAAGFRAPDARWIDEALAQLLTAGSESELCLATVDGELRVYRGELYVLSPPRQASVAAQPWRGEAELSWSGGRIRFAQVIGSGIRPASLESSEFVIRARRGGEHLQPDPRRPRRSLRNLLQERGVPPWERTRLPYLWHADQLVWVGGFACDAAWQCAVDEPGILPIWNCN